jgi:hypothetical protein
MQKIKQLYRKNYLGEDVVVDRVYENSKWNPTQEFVANPFPAQPLSDRALVIGNGTSRLDFDLRIILEHRVGNFHWSQSLSQRKFFTYGCNALYRDFKTDFLILTGNDDFIKDVAHSGECEARVVYAPNWALFDHPGKFNYIPQSPNWNSGAIAAYMAAFDGHKKVYLMGFDGNDTPNFNYNVYADTQHYPSKSDNVLEDFWVQSLAAVLSAYPDVEFIRVAPTEKFRTPEIWKYFLNFKTISFRQFVLEADV